MIFPCSLPPQFFFYFFVFRFVFFAYDLFFFYEVKKMKVNVYTIYDDVAKECGPIFQSKNDAVAFRAFNSLLENVPESSLCDYSLFCLGYLDSETMVFTPEEHYGRLVTEDFDVVSVGVDDILSDKELG